MDSNVKHGFVVQSSVMSLDLCPSKNFIPVTFIASIDRYDKEMERCILETDEACRPPVIFWDYYDDEREHFENKIFEQYEKRILELNSNDHINNYMKLCKIMCRCSDVQEASRIFYLFIDVLAQKFNNDFKIVVNFLETVCATEEAFAFIFTEKDNLKYLEFILHHLVKAKRFGFWLDCLIDYSLVSQYLFLEQYRSVILAIKYGLAWRYSESVLIDLCKVLNSAWTVDMPVDLENSALISLDRFFLVVQTFFVIRDWRSSGNKDSLYALLLTWKSTPEPFVTCKEMITCIRNFLSPSSSITPNDVADICDEYRILFWDNQDQPVSPRSLQDLCRCSIRSRMAENFQLPCGLSELNVPFSMRTYLSLEM